MQEAFFGSKSLFVWLTDAWHFAQTIETFAWILALLAIIRFVYLNINNSNYLNSNFLSIYNNKLVLIIVFIFSVLTFYSGFLFLFDWLLVI